MNAIILIESHQQLIFFKKFKNYFKTENRKAIILTDKLSIYIILKLTPVFKIHLIEKRGKKIIVPDLKATVECITNRFSKNKAELLYRSVYGTAELFIKKDNNFVLFIWGGNTIGSLALKNLSQSNSIPALFFDFGNYKDKIFVDPYGTNIDSFIYNNYELVLNSYYNNIITDDINFSYRRVRHRFTKMLNVLFFFDVVHSWITGLPFRGEKNVIKKLYNKTKLLSKKQNNVVLTQNKFYFIAFSHSYEIKKLNLTFLEVVKGVNSIIADAKNKGIMVLAKFHPDEIDRDFLNIVDKLQTNNVFKIVYNDANELIEKAKKVYLYNTSLAIPALLKDKDIMFMCKSFFDKFSKSTLYYYLDFYLIKLDMDNKGFFLKESVDEIFNRLEFSKNNL